MFDIAPDHLKQFQKNQPGMTGIFSFLNSKVLLFLFVVITFSSCTKEETVTDNVAPPDLTIEDVTISNYVNRVYISVLGREPDSNEKNSGFSLLRSTNLSSVSRSSFLDAIFTRPDYKGHLYDLARIDLLNNLDTQEIHNQLLTDSFALTIFTDTNIIIALHDQINHLELLREVPHDLQNSSIDATVMFRRCVYNYFYDQINMGTENFVKAVFLSFLLRSPTAYELSQSEQMIDNGQAAILFLQSGQSKNDFLNIFFSSSDYAEGIVLNLYQRYLNRTPTSVEMSDETHVFQLAHNYQQVQKDILSKNEYIFR